MNNRFYDNLYGLSMALFTFYGEFFSSEQYRKRRVSSADFDIFHMCLLIMCNENNWIELNGHKNTQNDPAIQFRIYVIASE